jgi:hypothetical protein
VIPSSSAASAALRWKRDGQARADREAEGRDEWDEEYGSVSIPQEAFTATLRMGGE